MGVVFRTLGMPLVWYDEVASILLAWLTFYGARAGGAQARAHRLPRAGQCAAARRRLRRSRAVREVCMIAFFVLLGLDRLRVLESSRGDTLVSLPNVPVALTQSVIPSARVLFVVAELLNLPEVRCALRPRAPASDDHEQGRRTDERSSLIFSACVWCWCSSTCRSRSRSAIVAIVAMVASRTAWIAAQLPLGHVQRAPPTSRSSRSRSSSSRARS